MKPKKKLNIKTAIRHPGALRADLGAKPGETIDKTKLAKAAKAPGKTGRRARFALLLLSFQNKKKPRRARRGK